MVQPSGEDGGAARLSVTERADCRAIVGVTMGNGSRNTGAPLAREGDAEVNRFGSGVNQSQGCCCGVVVASCEDRRFAVDCRVAAGAVSSISLDLKGGGEFGVNNKVGRKERR